MLALGPYAVTKAYWALGGTAGIPPGFSLAEEFRRNGAPEVIVWLEEHGIDFTSVLALAGAALLAALIHSWGTRLPRWTLLIPAWAGAALFIPYGLLTLVVSVVRDGGGGTGLTSWIVVAAVIAFTGVGATLAVCARSYQRRSRPVRV